MCENEWFGLSIEEIGELTEAFDKGFQKGKLEAIKDELNFLREIEKGTSCIDTKMFLKLRIEQLQKEIGEEKGK